MGDMLVGPKCKMLAHFNIWETENLAIHSLLKLGLQMNQIVHKQLEFDSIKSLSMFVCLYTSQTWA